MLAIQTWQPLDYALVRVTANDDLIFVPPIYSPVYWEIPRWWKIREIDEPYKYESCARVDYGIFQIYVDGTAPNMYIDIYVDGKFIYFNKWRSIRRVLICKDLEAVNQRTTSEYIDVDFAPRDGYIVRYDGLEGLDVIDWGEIEVENYFDCKPIDKLPTLDSDQPLAAKSTRLFDVCVNINSLPILDNTRVDSIFYLSTIDTETLVEQRLTKLFSNSVDINSLPLLSDAYSAQ